MMVVNFYFVLTVLFFMIVVHFLFSFDFFFLSFYSVANVFV